MFAGSLRKTEGGEDEVTAELRLVAARDHAGQARLVVAPLFAAAVVTCVVIAAESFALASIVWPR